MSDMHSFSVDVARKVGVNAAILLQSIKWWCEKNKANGKHEHDGLYWTYNSVRAWQELYPYLGKSAIDSALKRLEERGYIKTGNYNKNPYDRTKWYAITETGLAAFGNSIFENQEMEDAKTVNQSAENQEPIPVTKQVQDRYKERKKASAFDAIIAERTDNPRLRETIGEFIRMRSRIKKPLTNYALQMRLNKLWRLGKTDEERIAIAEQSIGSCWQDFYPLRDLHNTEQVESFAEYAQTRPGDMKVVDGVAYEYTESGTWEELRPMNEGTKDEVSF